MAWRLTLHEGLTEREWTCRAESQVRLILDFRAVQHGFGVEPAPKPDALSSQPFHAVAHPISEFVFEMLEFLGKVPPAQAREIRLPVLKLGSRDPESLLDA